MLLDRKNLGGRFSYLALRRLEYGSFENLFKSGKTREMSFTLGAIEQAIEWNHYTFLGAVQRDKKLPQLLSKGCRMLDVGCGTGGLLAKMHRQYLMSNFGIDPSSKAVARKISKGNPIRMTKQCQSQSFKAMTTS
jgi:SAM-dependent methyltransferase